MRLLLDTHALLWYTTNGPRLSRTAAGAIVGPANVVFPSPASYWEIAIKTSIGKLALNQPYEDLMDSCLNRYRFVVLPIEPSHTARVALLPFPPNHKGPFDRLIVAQALVEGASLVSADLKLDAYGVSRIW